MNTCELSIDAGVDCRTAPPPSSGRGLRRLLSLLEEWHERAEGRRQLEEMPEYLLRDIGLSAADVYRESRKPFWRR